MYTHTFKNVIQFISCYLALFFILKCQLLIVSVSYHSTCYRSPHNLFLGNSHFLFTFSLWVSFSVHSPQEIFCLLHTHKLVPCYWYLAASTNVLVSDSADLMENCVFTNYSLDCFVVLDLLQDIVSVDLRW